MSRLSIPIIAIAGSIATMLLTEHSAAQSFLGTAAASCIPLPASRQHNLTVTTPIGRGNSVIIVAAVDAAAATDVSASDSRGNVYSGVAGRQGNAAGTTSILLRAPLQQALALGDIVTVRYGSINAGQNSCVAIYAFSQLAASQQVVDTAGSNDGLAATTLAVSGIGSSRNIPNLVFAGFATNGSVGTVSVGPPAIALPSLCSSSGTVCLAAAYRASNSAASQAMSVAIGTARNWSGVLATLHADSIFFSGFD